MDKKEIAKRLKALIAENKQREAIDEMFKLVSDFEADGLHILSSRLNRLEDQQSKNTIGKNDADIEINKISEGLIGFANKIGRGEKITFAPLTYSIEAIEHDKYIYNESSKILDFNMLDDIADDLGEIKYCKFKDRDSLVDFYHFLRHPANEFVIESISEKRIVLKDAVGSLLDFINEYFEPKNILSNGLQLTPEKKTKKLKQLEQTLLEITKQVFNAYLDFRIEIKRKLII